MRPNLGGNSPVLFRKLQATIMVLVGLLTASLPAASADQPEPTAGYIVVLREGRDSQQVSAQHAKDHGFNVGRTFTRALNGYSARIPQARVDKIKLDPDVAFVSADRRVQAAGSDPMLPGDSAPTGVRRTEAATQSPSATTVRQAGNSGVAVLDTGIDLDHPDLNAVDGENCVSPGSSSDDDNGHGSHAAGTIGAKNNGVGVVGVAPGTTLHSVKVLDNYGFGSWSQVICGIDWITANSASLNIKVANMSFVGSGSNDGNCGNTNGDALHLAICNATASGVTFVAAAGNAGAGLSGYVPAAYPEVLTATAVSDSDGKPGGAGGAPGCATGELDDRYASTSNFAASPDEALHTVAAPGVCISSTWRDGTYRTSSGTSTAAPAAAGSVALCIGNGGMPGPCSAMSAPDVIQQVRAEAALRAQTHPGYGFAGDPNSPAGGRFYGHLVWDGGSAAADFSLSANPDAVTITSGSSADFSLTVTPDGGFDETLTLSATAPNQVGVSPASVASPSPYFPITYSVGSEAPGTYLIGVTASGGGLSRSATVLVTVNATVPSAPTGLTAAWSAPAKAFNLSWSAPQSTGGSPIAQYRVYRGTSSGSVSLLTTVGPGATSFKDAAVTRGKRYYYKITAVNEVGEGPASNEASATSK